MKFRYALLTLSVFAGITEAETITDACFNCPELSTIADAASFDDSSYYAEVFSAITNSYSQAEIKERLMLAIKNNHKNLTYSEAWTALTETDEDPNNSENVLLLYKGTSIAKFSNGSGSQSSNPDNWNREHVWAKSHGFPSSSTEAYSDIHHLRPTDISVNSSRGNLDFDNSDSPLSEAPENRVDSDSFEPRNQVKGDVARMLFYMDTRYEGQDITPDLELVDRVTSVGEAKLGTLCRLIEWHKNDPIDEVEISRNNRIYEFQGNRNPFIDHPEWVDLLFSADTCANTEPPTPDPDPEPEPDPNPEPTPSAGSVFISEYIEGSSYNKAIELYNPSSDAINLADLNYVLVRYSNGSTSGTNIALEGVISANGTFVIANPQAVQDVLDNASQITGSLSHNGDDAYVLLKDGVTVDSFGRVGEDPGSQWGSDATKTKDNTLIRKASILVGDSNAADAFDPAQQWSGTSNNDFSNLGSHTIDSPEVFISEYIEGSSYNKAIEIYNPSSGSVDLSGANYILTRYSNGSSSGTDIMLTGTIAPKGTFVIANPSASQDILDQATQTSGSLSHNGDDAYVLYKNGEIIDSFGRVGEDPGSQWGSDTSKTKDNTLVRKPSVSIGDIEIDDAFEPSIEWQGLGNNATESLGSHTTSDVEPEEPISQLGQCFDDATLISAVQGDAASSPLAGENRVIEAIVTGVFPNLQGFYLQEELVDQDANETTSEGVFIYNDKNTVTPSVGDVVRVLGTIKEHYGNTQLSANEDILVCGTDSVTPTELSFPLASEDALESVEGMLVNINQTLTVTDNYSLSRYGEFTVATERLYNPTQVATPGEAANQVKTENALKKLLIDDGSTIQNADSVPYPAPELSAQNSLRVGSTVSNLQGVINYSFSKYRLHPTVSPSFVDSNPRTETPQLDEAGDLKVASFNVLNFFNGDGKGAGFPTSRGADSFEEFVRQRDKLITALLAMDADVVGLMELENDGFGEFSAISDLVSGLNDNTSDGQWAFVNLNAEQIGTDKITSGIIYRSDRVAEVGTASFTTAEPFHYGNRPPVVQTFNDLANNDKFTLVVTHLRSKGSCGSATGADVDLNDGQGCWNATRVNAVNALFNWLSSSPTGITESDYILLGDMNAYGMEDPISAIKAAGLSHIMQELHGNHTHSYIYQGESGSLDHAFASPSMRKKVKAITDWHINADEPNALDYNMEYKSEYQLSNFYANNVYRTSDHDPIVISLDMALRGDMDGDDDVDVFDMRALILAIQHHKEIDMSFDLNSDGIINMLDVRVLRTICTNKGCAPK
ncbi:ExeM/NucH family extracellular endonuclease [Thalassotalea sp. M1531]|uniref:ExeM/NucH family extracellular endonuclease n=1 Tax=Thalassotalea algicola TaxID=2716224 RepID=A0A7Y0LDK2_9GAMM|nr:ExeM/NucH family extracellular endonuclease [Thalassotalea algicola]NMP32578.1 ExeM/NucH family extracellular endonuclease [Thalassotalea algicola]